MVTVRALLAGQEFDLQDLTELFPSGDLTVTKDEKGYWLSSVSLEPHREDAVALDVAASDLLERVVGAARLARPGIRPVTLVHRYSVEHPDRVKHHTIVQAENIAVRARANVVAVGEVLGAVPDGPAEPMPETDEQRALRLAAANEDVSRALKWLAGDQSWYDLWKVYETVSHAVGGPDVMAKRWDIPKGKFRAFRVSANLAEVSGEAARHAPSTTPPDPNVKTMTHDEGREFVRTLVTLWLQDIDAETPPSAPPTADVEPGSHPREASFSTRHVASGAGASSCGPVSARPLPTAQLGDDGPAGRYPRLRPLHLYPAISLDLK